MSEATEDNKTEKSEKGEEVMDALASKQDLGQTDHQGINSSVISAVAKPSRLSIPVAMLFLRDPFTECSILGVCCCSNPGGFVEFP